jgi:hypothetical protein
LSRAAPASAPLVSRYGVRPPGRSSGSRIILLSAPSHPTSAKQWHCAEFVPGHSGGTATVLPSSLLNPAGYLGCKFIPKGGGHCQSYLQSGCRSGCRLAYINLTKHRLSPPGLRSPGPGVGPRRPGGCDALSRRPSIYFYVGMSKEMPVIAIFAGKIALVLRKTLKSREIASLSLSGVRALLCK